MNKRAIKKFFLYFSLSILLATSISFFYMFFPKSLESIDNRLRDYFFTLRGEIPNSKNVVIVDIDEKSLKKLGQWPWSRNIIAKILENLSNNSVALIALDIVFPEEDKSSPHKVLKKLGIEKKSVPNYDLELARTISNTPTILGYQFEFKEDNKYLNKEAPHIPAIFIERNKIMGEEYLLKATGTILNMSSIQNSAYSSGFFNNVPDISGIIRSVPLIISYNDIIYPSLSLEVLRIITQTQKVFINYNSDGVVDISLNNINIPTDRHGRLLINFRGKENNFKYLSASDIYQNKIDKKELENKIVLIGTSATGLRDLRATPFESIYPGVEIHANVIDNILTGDFISQKSWFYQIDIAIIFALSILVMILITYSPFWLNPIITIFSIIFTTIFLYKMLFSYGMILNILFPISTIVFSAIITTLFDYFYKIKQEEAIKKKFASKVSKKVMENLLKNIESTGFQVMEKEVTIFFSDIRGFTNLSEEMNSAKNLVEYLNEYLEPMSNIITKYEGTIDKYIGDAIMAYWNAPANVENHPDKAVQASLAQLKSLKKLNKKLKEKNKPIIEIGIGINTGVAIVGEMGSIKRSDYTVIGDSINLGARVESLCKYYGSSLNITNFTKDQLKEKYVLRLLDYVTVKGKSEAIEIWQVYDKGVASKEQKKELKNYHKALDLYQNSKFEEALKLFEELENSSFKSNDKINNIYIQRCKEYIKTPPKEFNGVYIHETKA